MVLKWRMQCMHMDQIVFMNSKDLNIPFDLDYTLDIEGFISN